MEMMRPVFVAIDGIDASGKETQARKLAEVLGARLFTFPDKDSPTGELIYSHLAGEWKCRTFGLKRRMSSDRDLVADGVYVDGMAFQCMQIVNRMERAAEIVHTLNSGRPVVADRYTASALYGVAEGLDREWVVRAQSFLPRPDAYILIDIMVEESFARRPEHRDIYESDRSFLEKVAREYRLWWQTAGWPMVNGMGTPEEVHRSVLAAVELEVGPRMKLGSDRP